MLGSLGDRIRMSDATSASGHNGDGRTSGWLDLVANGPKRTGAKRAAPPWATS